MTTDLDENRGPVDRPAPHAEPPPRIALRASLFAVLFVLVLGVGAGVLGFGLDRVTDREGFADLALVIVGPAAFAAAALVAILSARRRPREYLPLRVPGAKAWIGAAALGIGTALLNMTLPIKLLAYLDDGYAEMLEAMLENVVGLATPLGALLLLGVLVPVGEEILFRGVILRSLLDRWGTWPAILVSSLVFAVFHLHPVHGLVALVLGISAAWAMVATGSLWAAVAVHVTNNSLGVVLGLVAADVEAAPLWVLVPAAAALAMGGFLLRPLESERGGEPGPPAGPTPGPVEGVSAS